MQLKVAIRSLDAILRAVLDSTPSPEKSLSPSHHRREARTEAILRAALEELAEVGYSAFSFESVAARVGIAKTTVYRRYATKLELVRAAVRHFVNESAGEPPDTGSLRGDLVAMGRHNVELMSSVLGQGMMRTRLLDSIEPEHEQLARELDVEWDEKNRSVARRAVARGELQSEAELLPLIEVLAGAIMFKLIIKRRSVSELEIAHVVDLLLHGVSKATPRTKVVTRG